MRRLATFVGLIVFIIGSVVAANATIKLNEMENEVGMVSDVPLIGEVAASVTRWEQANRREEMQQYQIYGIIAAAIGGLVFLSGLRSRGNSKTSTPTTQTSLPQQQSQVSPRVRVCLIPIPSEDTIKHLERSL